MFSQLKLWGILSSGMLPNVLWLKFSDFLRKYTLMVKAAGSFKMLLHCYHILEDSPLKTEIMWTCISITISILRWNRSVSWNVCSSCFVERLSICSVVTIDMNEELIFEEKATIDGFCYATNKFIWAKNHMRRCKSWSFQSVGRNIDTQIWVAIEVETTGCLFPPTLFPDPLLTCLVWAM